MTLIYEKMNREFVQDRFVAGPPEHMFEFIQGALHEHQEISGYSAERG